MIDDIIDTACVVFDLPRAALTSASRAAHVVQARQATMLALRRRTGLSLLEIGKLFGGRDHSTVRSAIERAEVRCRADAEYRVCVNALLDVPSVAGRAARSDVRLRWALASSGGIVTALAA